MTPAAFRKPFSTRSVALLIESSRAYGRALLLGISKFVRQHRNWSVQSEEWRWTDGPPAWLKAWRGDGIIARVETREVASAIQALRIPAVDVRGSVGDSGLPLIDTDDEKVAILAAEHLLSRGFRQFAFCGFVGANYSDKRCRWFQARLARAGFRCSVYQPPEAPRDRQTIEYEKQGLFFQDDVAAWLLRLPKPVGLMACNDIRGQQVTKLCRRSGLMVPEEVAVVGVDNDEVLCELSDPPLTSVVPDAAGIGYDAAVLLDGLMAGKPPPPKPVLVAPLGVITRGSSDVLALEDPQLAAGLRFLRENAFHRLDVSEVARAAGLSRRVLERRFLARVGRSPKAEVIRLRLERAKELLHETHWPLAEIAEKTGFTHAEYLHAVFTGKTGMTPGAFRKRRQAAADQPSFRQPRPRRQPGGAIPKC